MRIDNDDTASDGPKAPMERLKEESRIRGETRMFLEGKDPATITRELAEPVIKAVIDYIEASGGQVTRSFIARCVGVQPSTLGQVLNWRYGGAWQEIVLDLDRWLDAQKKADAAPKNSQFVWTTVAEEIKTVADVVCECNSIGLVYGPETAGIGKTMCLQAIAEDRAGSILITTENLTSSASGIIKSLASALKISEWSSAKAWNRIKEKLTPPRAAEADRSLQRLILVDQIHNLCECRDNRGFYILCDLWDATRCPQLWAGTSDVVSYLNEKQARGKDSMAQIRSRIMIERDLMERTRGKDKGGGGEPLATIADVRRVFAAGKMRLAPDAEQYLYKLINAPESGAYRTASHLVRTATKINCKDHTMLTEAMLRSCYRLMCTKTRFDIAEARMAPSTKPIAKSA